MIFLQFVIAFNLTGVLDPLKQFYNKKVLEFGIKRATPFVKRTVNNTIISVEKDMIKDAPQWLQGTLADLLGVSHNSTEVGKRFGIFQPLFDLLFKVFRPIINMWKMAIKKELQIILANYERNVNSEIIKELRNRFSIKKRGILQALGRWYRVQVDKVIGRVVFVLNLATHTTLEQTVNDFGIRMGNRVKEIINWFMPEEWKVQDLDWVEMPVPTAKFKGFNPIAFIRNKIKEIILSMQSKLQNFVRNRFIGIESAISVIYMNGVTKAAMENLPFYNRTLLLSG